MAARFDLNRAVATARPAMPTPRTDIHMAQRGPAHGAPRGTSAVAGAILSPASLIALCAAIAAASGLLHAMLVDGPAHDGQVDAHLLLITGRGPYPDQYRILSFLLAEGLMRLGVPFSLSYQLPRFVFTAASLYVFHEYLRGFVRPSLALLGLFMLAAALPLTFLFYSMQPSDPLNMLVFFLGFWALARYRDEWLVPLTAVGVLNRETALLLPLLQALVRVRRAPPARWLPSFCLASLAGVAGYAGLRVVFGLRPAYAPVFPPVYWRANAIDRATWIQLAGFFNLTLWMGWRAWRVQPEFLRRAVWLVPLFLVIHFSVGNVREVRYFLPLLPVLVPITLIALERAEEAQTRPSSAPAAPPARERVAG
jgi:hypothetical protein